MAAREKAPKARDPGDERSPSFEEEVRELGVIVEQLEGGELPLEESLALFERGVTLARRAQARLDAAEQRVEELLGIDEAGRPITREIVEE
ncbi:MAG TPA: exodeoxyribonuclease VII small subunit [Polyangiaceae bacterium]|nr:exodeoxyribonuclease VII small subunit [Polyangiaceae bacterium]